MLYPEHIAEKLGFSEIKEKVKDCCLSTMGRSMVERMRFITRYDELKKLLNQTAEFKRILESDAAFPSSSYLDIKEMAQLIKTEGTYLPEEELLAMSQVLRTVFDIIRYCRQRAEIYPLLEQLLQDIHAEHSLLKIIEQVIDDTGKLKPNASDLYASLGRQITSLERDARRKVDHQFKEAQREGWSGDGNLTIRDGRLCIPILAEHKRKLKGFIHDESATGQTVYMEPAEVFELNNQVRDLEFDKRREKIRILKQVAEGLRDYYESLLEYHGLLTKIDFIRAKAVFAGKIEANMPDLLHTPECRIIGARHPLLFLNFQKTGGTLVPLNMKIDSIDRIVLVSGPNAGGKSVCLKTLGLLQLMLQSGLLLPVDPASAFGLYTNILVDIGDDQSLESDLSTYSAHLTNMRVFVEQADEKTLILIDEFGTGTDPLFGGPIAEAVLQVLNEKKVRGLVTTHYSNLKSFASAQEGLINASMLFDNAQLKPLYILEQGKPGSSYAFEIARKIGLPAKIIHLAQEKISEEQKRVDHLLVNLEQDKKKLMDQQVQADKMERRLNFLLDENEKLKEYFEENRKRLVGEARKEAESILQNANKLVENTIQQIKSNKAEKEPTRLIRKKLDEGLETLRKEKIPKEKPPLESKEAVKPAELRDSDWVKIEGQDNPGQIISVNKGNAVIALGDLRMVVKLDRLQRIDKKEEKKIGRSGYMQQMTQAAVDFSPELDIRGRRGEEALYEVERFLDRALMLNLPSLKIIHGKGDGILRKMIREYLKKYPAVSRMEDEHPDRGGDGITYVYLS